MPPWQTAPFCSIPVCNQDCFSEALSYSTYCQDNWMFYLLGLNPPGHDIIQILLIQGSPHTAVPANTYQEEFYHDNLWKKHHIFKGNVVTLAFKCPVTSISPLHNTYRKCKQHPHEYWMNPLGLVVLKWIPDALARDCVKQNAAQTFAS